jgi:hypothetical protein
MRSPTAATDGAELQTADGCFVTFQHCLSHHVSFVRSRIQMHRVVSRGYGNQESMALPCSSCRSANVSQAVRKGGHDRSTRLSLA